MDIRITGPKRQPAMTYSDEEMKEIERDPVRLRAYFWRVATNMRRTAKRNRAQSRAIGKGHPITNYLPAFEEGQDLIRWAKTLDNVADHVLENIDVIVESMLVTDEPVPGDGQKR